MKKKLFYFNTKTQYENFGDAIISRELLKLAKSKGTVHILVKNTPKDFLDIVIHDDYKKYNNTLVFLSSLILSTLTNSHTFYLLNPGGFGGDVAKAEKYKQYLLIIVYMFFNIIGVKLIRLGASLSNLSKNKAKLESRKSKYIYYNSYRDFLSVEIAKKNAIKVDDSFPDMAFLIQNNSYDLLFKKEVNIILSFRDREDSKIFDVINNDLINLDFIKEKSNRYKFLFCSQVDFDQSFNEKLMNLFVENEFKAEMINFKNKNQYFNLYQSSELIISNRLHVLLFALVSGTKVVALIEKDHDQKIIGIFKELGLEKLICDVNEIKQFNWDEINLISLEFIKKQIQLKKDEIYIKFNKLIDEVY